MFALYMLLAGVVYYTSVIILLYVLNKSESKMCNHIDMIDEE